MVIDSSTSRMIMPVHSTGETVSCERCNVVMEEKTGSFARRMTASMIPPVSRKRMFLPFSDPNFNWMGISMHCSKNRAGRRKRLNDNASGKPERVFCTNMVNSAIRHAVIHPMKQVSMLRMYFSLT